MLTALSHVMVDHCNLSFSCCLDINMNVFWKCGERFRVLVWYGLFQFFLRRIMKDSMMTHCQYFCTYLSISPQSCLSKGMFHRGGATVEASLNITSSCTLSQLIQYYLTCKLSMYYSSTLIDPFQWWSPLYCENKKINKTKECPYWHWPLNIWPSYICLKGV